jgi:2-methylcitrate dehydratase PrpD
MTAGAASVSVTGTLAEFVAGTRFEDLPAPARHAAKRMLFDTAGVAIAGARDPAFSPVRAHAMAHAGRGAVPAPAPRPLDVLWAALTGGVAAHLLDYDDFHSTIGGHPSAPLFPVIVSLGHALHASGAAAIRAFALGAEVEARIAAGINPAHYNIGWHPTSVIGALGACAAAASLLDLDAAGVRRAFGLAASHACGTKANFGTLTKSVHVGLAARSGIESALLAQAGGTANDRILDEQFGGFCELFSTATNRGRMAAGLGERYLIVNRGSPSSSCSAAAAPRGRSGA